MHIEFCPSSRLKTRALKTLCLPHPSASMWDMDVKGLVYSMIVPQVLNLTLSLTRAESDAESDAEADEQWPSV